MILILHKRSIKNNERPKKNDAQNEGVERKRENVPRAHKYVSFQSIDGSTLHFFFLNQSIQFDKIAFGLCSRKNTTNRKSADDDE